MSRKLDLAVAEAAGIQRPKAILKRLFWPPLFSTTIGRAWEIGNEWNLTWAFQEMSIKEYPFTTWKHYIVAKVYVWSNAGLLLCDYSHEARALIKDYPEGISAAYAKARCIAYLQAKKINWQDDWTGKR